MSDDKRKLEEALDELTHIEELFEEANGYTPNIPMDFNSYELTDDELFEQIHGSAPNVPVNFNNYELPAQQYKTRSNNSLRIAAAILSAFMAIFSAYMLFFNPSQERLIRNSELNGAWLYQEGDLVSYYVFNKDGSLMLKTGDVAVVTNYGISTEDKNAFYLYSPGDVVDTENVTLFNFKTAKGEDGVKTLEIMMDGAESLIMQRSELPETSVKPSENFAVKEEILGTWENSDYKLGLSVRDDGYLTLDITSTLYEASYIVDGNRVDFTYTTSYTDAEPITDSFYYELDGDTLMFYFDNPDEGAQGLPFTKVN